MRAFAKLMVALILILAVATTFPGAAALEEGPGDSVQADDDPSTDTAVGRVVVIVVEWQPDLSGVGAGLFTESEFDFSVFFSELGESLAGLLGL